MWYVSIIFNLVSLNCIFNYIRFNKRQTRHMGCDGLLWDYENPYMSLTGTNGWSNNPYFGRKSKMIEWYEMMEESGQIGGSDDKFDPTIEVYLQKRSREALNESMEKWLKDWGVFIYGKQGDPILAERYFMAANLFNYDGVFAEIHPRPNDAVSDGDCQLSVSQFREVLKKTRMIDALPPVGRHHRVVGD